MIKLEELKKGDHVLVVASDLSDPRYGKSCTEVVVTSLGKKFINVQPVRPDGTLYGRADKYYNDEHRHRVDWEQWRLFLGTKEEWRSDKMTQEICREVRSKICEELGYEKLKAIMDIINS